MSTRKKYAPVEKHDGYIRDLNSNAIISNDRAGYEAFLEKKREKRTFMERLDNLEKTLDKILERLDAK